MDDERAEYHTYRSGTAEHTHLVDLVVFIGVSPIDIAIWIIVGCIEYQGNVLPPPNTHLL